MSWVNNAVVVYGMESRDRMAEVNAYLFENDHRQQQFCTGDDWYGGTKFMEGTVWGAAFNYVTFDVVMEALQSAQWAYPEKVILLWKGETDYEWNVYHLGDDEENTEDYWR